MEITKLSNGVVKISGDDVIFLSPDKNIFPHKYNPNYVVITKESDPNTDDKFLLDWRKVTNPVVNSRDELMNELATNFFFKNIDNNIIPEFSYLKVGEGDNFFEVQQSGNIILHGESTSWKDAFTNPATAEGLGASPPIKKILASDETPTIGKAFYFYGAPSKMEIPESQFFTSKNFSWSFWIKPKDNTNFELIDRKLNDSIEIYLYGARVYFQLRNSYRTYTEPIIIANALQHIVCTAKAQNDGSTIIKIYVNGIEQSQDIVNTENNQAEGEGWIIGEWNNGGWNYEGVIDAIQYYNITLTDAQIINLYNNGQGKQGIAENVDFQNLILAYYDDYTNQGACPDPTDLSYNNITLDDGLILSEKSGFGVVGDAYPHGRETMKFFSKQLNHDKILRDSENDGRIFPHFHIVAEDTNEGNFVLFFEYTWHQIGMPIPKTIIFDIVINNDTIGVDGKPIERLIDIPVEGIISPFKNEALSSIIEGRIGRKGNDERDTYEGDIFITQFDFHYPIDGFGSNEILIK